MSTSPCGGCTSRDICIAELSARIADLERVHLEPLYLRDQARAERDLRPLTGNSAAMKAVQLAVQQVVRTDSTVFIQGETGTGKELVARAIHRLSARRERLLVAVNCAALTGALITSELFVPFLPFANSPAGIDILRYVCRTGLGPAAFGIRCGASN